MLTRLSNSDDSGQTSRLTREVLDLLNRLLYGQDFLMKQAELKEECMYSGSTTGLILAHSPSLTLSLLARSQKGEDHKLARSYH